MQMINAYTGNTEPSKPVEPDPPKPEVTSNEEKRQRRKSQVSTMTIKIDGEGKQSTEIDLNRPPSTEIDLNDIKFAMAEQKTAEKTARENRHRRSLERKASLEMLARTSDSEPNNESPKLGCIEEFKPAIKKKHCWF